MQTKQQRKDLKSISRACRRSSNARSTFRKEHIPQPPGGIMHACGAALHVRRCRGWIGVGTSARFSLRKRDLRVIDAVPTAGGALVIKPLAEIVTSPQRDGHGHPISPRLRACTGVWEVWEGAYGRARMGGWYGRMLAWEKKDGGPLFGLIGWICMWDAGK